MASFEQEHAPNDSQEQFPPRLQWYDRKEKKWNTVDETGLIPLTTLPPPRFHDPASNYWVYGWGVSPSIYRQILKERFGLEIIPDFPLKTGALVRSRLKHMAGYRDLFTIYCKTDAQSEREGLVVLLSEEAWGPGNPSLPAVQVLGFVCTASIRHYTRRPTAKQLATLCDYLGKPRWFECAEPKEGFEPSWLDDD